MLHPKGVNLKNQQRKLQAGPKVIYRHHFAPTFARSITPTHLSHRTHICQEHLALQSSVPPACLYQELLPHLSIPLHTLLTRASTLPLISPLALTAARSTPPPPPLICLTALTSARSIHLPHVICHSALTSDRSILPPLICPSAITSAQSIPHTSKIYSLISARRIPLSVICPSALTSDRRIPPLVDHNLTISRLAALALLGNENFHLTLIPQFGLRGQGLWGALLSNSRTAGL